MFPRRHHLGHDYACIVAINGADDPNEVVKISAVKVVEAPVFNDLGKWDCALAAHPQRAFGAKVGEGFPVKCGSLGRFPEGGKGGFALGDVFGFFRNFAPTRELVIRVLEPPVEEAD